MKKLLFFFILVITSACELVIDVDQPPFKPSIVLGSFIGPDTTVTVLLSEDRDILSRSNAFDPITGATVQFFEGERFIGELEEIESSELLDQAQGFYQLIYRPTPGAVYRIEVQKDGFTGVQASDQVPSEIPQFEVVNLELGEFYDSEIDLRIMDQPGRDYYEVRVYLSVTEVIEASSSGATGEWTIDSVRRDTYPIDIYTDNIAVEEHNISIFSDRLFDGRSYELDFEAYVDVSGQREPRIERNPVLTVEVRRVSEAYYNYINSSALQSWIEGDPFAEPVQAFSNVENGRGVFGSYVSSRQDFPIEDGQ